MKGKACFGECANLIGQAKEAADIADSIEALIIPDSNVAPEWARLFLEVRSALYFYMAVQEIFTADPSSRLMKELRKEPDASRSAWGHCLSNRLARARTLLPVSTSAAHQELTELRETYGLTILEPIKSRN